MENSIEEDVKILESIIKINNDYLKGVENQTINQKEIKAIEHILSDYKRVLQENEKLKAKLLDTLEGQKVIKEETPQYIKENYILKDKIEEILSETEITDFNSLVEAFLEIKKLLESE